MSNINPSMPEAGTPTTASVRENFAIAKAEIEAIAQGLDTTNEALNELKESVGNWTPGIWFSGGTHNVQIDDAKGRYYVHGRGWQITGSITVTITGTNTGQMKIGGMQVSVMNNAGPSILCNVIGSRLDDEGGFFGLGWIPPGADKFMILVPSPEGYTSIDTPPIGQQWSYTFTASGWV